MHQEDEEKNKTQKKKRVHQHPILSSLTLFAHHLLQLLPLRFDACLFFSANQSATHARTVTGELWCAGMGLGLLLFALTVCLITTYKHISTKRESQLSE